MNLQTKFERCSYVTLCTIRRKLCMYVWQIQKPLTHLGLAQFVCETDCTIRLFSLWSKAENQSLYIMKFIKMHYMWSWWLQSQKESRYWAELQPTTSQSGTNAGRLQVLNDSGADWFCATVHNQKFLLIWKINFLHITELQQTCRCLSNYDNLNLWDDLSQLPATYKTT